MQPLTATQRSDILNLLDSGISAHNIASKLHVSIASISQVRSKYRPDLPKSTGGRPHKLTSANIDYARRMICMGKVDNAVQAAKALQDVTNQPVCSQTLRNNLKKAGMRPVVKRKRPLLQKRHIRDRLDFAESHKEWTLEDWKKVLWSDETKINRLGSDGRTYVWKDVGEGLSKRTVEGTVKFGGGNVKMWGCMGWDGVGYATRIEGKMDAELYVSILDDELMQSLEYYGLSPEEIIFQQDNDPKHTSGLATRWFNDNDIIVMKWPAQSPDLNPIEHLWHYLKKKLLEYEVPPKGIHELWERIEKEWNEIPAETCQKLIESMPRRIEAVLKAKGGYTKY